MEKNTNRFSSSMYENTAKACVVKQWGDYILHF